MLAALTAEGVIHAGRSGADRKQHGRLTLFCAASILLHVLALAVNPQGGVGSGLGDGTPAVLHVLLSPLRGAFSSDDSDSAPETVPDSAPAASRGPVPGGTAHDGARPASNHGITAEAFPVPDQWFPADELSVRAEPLSDVQIGYPAELAEIRLVGRVKLLLYIDEHGFVRRTHVDESIPEGVFDRTALAAWADVRFSPAMKDGIAVKSRKRLEISFLP